MRTMSSCQVNTSVVEVRAALTVNVATLLVTLPAELLKTTVNCEPLSEAVVAGVV